MQVAEAGWYLIKYNMMEIDWLNMAPCRGRKVMEGRRVHRGVNRKFISSIKIIFLYFAVATIDHIELMQSAPQTGLHAAGHKNWSQGGRPTAGFT